VLPEKDTPKALLVRDDIRARVHEIIAPDVFPIELGHALTRAERQGRLSQADGYAQWLTVMTDAPKLFSSLPLMPRAYELSSHHRIGIYDCLYLALAEQEQCDLLTADDRLIKSFKGQIGITSFAQI
jgi:predicted nucleic acid-binding protein